MPSRSGHRVNGDAALAAFCCAAISGALGYGLAHDLALSADGAEYFAKILDRGEFVDHERTRQHADLVSQWPLVLAVRFGVSDVALLKHVFAFGLHLPHLVALVLCAYARRSLGMSMLLFPLASTLLVSLPAAFVLVGESHVMALASWPILFLLLRPQLSRVDGALLVALLVAFCRTYETAALPAALFAAIALARLRERPAVDRWPYLATLLGAGVTIGVGVYGTLLPVSVENRSDFVTAIAISSSHPAFLASLAALLLLGVGILRPHRWPLAASVATAMVSPVLPRFGIAATAAESFDSRTLTLTVLPLLLVAATLASRRPPRLDRARAVAVGAVFALLSLGYALSWAGWLDFRDRFRNVLATTEGYVPVEHTPLQRDPYRWNWSFPLLSVLWSDTCVRSIVLNRDGEPWQPFDPRVSLPLQRYLPFADPLRPAAPASRPCP